MKDVLEKRQKAERQARRDRILHAGRKLMLKKGYANTTMRDICQEAQLSTGAVYFYFKGKDEIYAQVCEESFNLLISMFSKTFAEHSDPLERLKALKATYLEFYLKHNDRWVMLSSGFRNVGLPNDLFNKLDALDQKAISLACDTVEAYLADQNLLDTYTSREINLVLWASFEGLMTLHNQKHLPDTGSTIEEMAEKQLQIILKGLAVTRPST